MQSPSLWQRLICWSFSNFESRKHEIPFFWSKSNCCHQNWVTFGRHCGEQRAFCLQLEALQYWNLDQMLDWHYWVSNLRSVLMTPWWMNYWQSSSWWGQHGKALDCPKLSVEILDGHTSVSWRWFNVFFLVYTLRYCITAPRQGPPSPDTIAIVFACSSWFLNVAPLWWICSCRPPHVSLYKWLGLGAWTCNPCSCPSSAPDVVNPDMLSTIRCCGDQKNHKIA